MGEKLEGLVGLAVLVLVAFAGTLLALLASSSCTKVRVSTQPYVVHDTVYVHCPPDGRP